MKSARVKADQIRAVDAPVLATACENCHTQLADLNERDQLGRQVRFLTSLVTDALVR
jgi:Fe-S oxidoreductase